MMPRKPLTLANVEKIIVKERTDALLPNLGGQTGLGIPQPESGTARSVEEALAVRRKIGFPLMVRPSFVLGGRGMEVVR